MIESKPLLSLVPCYQSKKNPVLSIVVPCYNEEEVIQETARQLQEILLQLIGNGLIDEKSYILFIDDGSKDNTWKLVEGMHNRTPHVKGLKLARNVGHQHALFAGLMEARELADCVISIDADLQDDVTKMEDFILKYKEGYDVVYGVRSRRDTDTWFKKHTALYFYRLMQNLGVKVVYNHADYRLLSKRALEELGKFEESNLFLRGIVPLIGYKSAEVYYDRKERLAGESKYPLKKMVNFALQGITSFSVVPIRMVTVIGMIMVMIALVTGVYSLWGWMTDRTVPGWASTMLSIWLIGGIQAICLGLVGEYVGKIYQEVKRRPKYTVEEDLH